MSGHKPTPLQDFYTSFHNRGRTAQLVADFLEVKRVSVTRILNGSRRRGHLWPRIAEQLTPKEIQLLDVAHSVTWNTKNLLKRPTWKEAVASAVAAKEAA